MSHLKQFSLLSLCIAFFILLSFLYSGVINPPPLGDSHDYHMPIGRFFLDGTIFNIPKTVNPYIFFPGASEAILSLFILFNVPVNWFGILGWIILFFLLRRLGIHFGLGSELSIIFAMTFTATLSVLRQMNTQSIDIWMAVWFVLLVLLLEKPSKHLTYFLKLGILFGILIGSKYTGLFYMALLLLVYGLNLIKYLNWKNILVFVIPILLIGGSWYLRNFIMWDNPFYPIGVLSLPGLPGKDSIADYLLWKELLRGHGGTILVGLISEYLIWGLAFIPVLIIFIMNLKKRFLDEKTTRVLLLCTIMIVASLFMYSFKPTQYHFIVSNMRYLFSLIIMLILALFMLAKKYNKEKEITFIAILNAVTAFSYIIYHPKLIIIYLLIVSVVYLKWKRNIEKFIANKI